jgi:transposase InsO family protein
VVRYESETPGDLVHVDILHLFALKGEKPAYQFTLVDGHTPMAYAVIALRRTTDAALNAVKGGENYFGFPIKRVLTDNDVTFAWTPRPGWRGGPQGGITRFSPASGSRGRDRILKEWGIRHSVTRIRRPQTNGKVERFHRTIREELYRPHPLFSHEAERRAALSSYLSYYNNIRYHTALGGLTPVHSRNAYFKAHGV